MKEIVKYNIKLRLVEENDAEFIVDIRTDEKKSRFINKTNPNIEQQKTWIREYKIREKKNEEFYFIAIDENNQKFATYRLYNITKDSIEIGSFVSKPLYENPLNVIKVDILLKDFIFQELNFEILNFEVRKENKSVINYHKKFNPKIINEDHENIFFILEKNDFLNTKIKFEKIF